MAEAVVDQLEAVDVDDDQRQRQPAAVGALDEARDLLLEAATVEDPGQIVGLRQSFDRLQDEKPQSLCQYAGKVLLVVNTASFCGFTRQYEGLEALDRKYRADGLVVLGFPSNDFAQETGSNKEVADFCENTFGVKFPMFVKSAVRGSDANPLFKELARQTGTTPKWNFYKYLVGRDGKVVGRFKSAVAPNAEELTRAIKAELDKPAPGK